MGFELRSPSRETQTHITTPYLRHGALLYMEINNWIGPIGKHVGEWPCSCIIFLSVLNKLASTLGRNEPSCSYNKELHDSDIERRINRSNHNR